MLSSSGIDGAYMARWNAWAWAGYLLNTTTDAAGMVVMFYYGVLIRTSSAGTKRHKLARYLLACEGVVVFYSWFFSWRQLLLVMPAIEGADAQWVALVSAAFVPLLGAFIGFAQSLLLEPPSTGDEPGAKQKRTSGEPGVKLRTPERISGETNETGREPDELQNEPGAKQTRVDETKAVCVSRLVSGGETHAETLANLCACSQQYARRVMRKTTGGS